MYFCQSKSFLSPERAWPPARTKAPTSAAAIAKRTFIVVFPFGTSYRGREEHPLDVWLITRNWRGDHLNSARVFQRAGRTVARSVAYLCPLFHEISPGIHRQVKSADHRAHRAHDRGVDRCGNVTTFPVETAKLKSRDRHHRVSGDRGMQLCKVQLETKQVRVGVVEEGHVRLLNLEHYVGLHALSDVLHAPDPDALARELLDDDTPSLPLREVSLLAPIDQQEVWAAG